MRAEIISIGTEILIGSILNTNARFLSQTLAQNGIDVYHHVTVGDNLGRIVECFETAVKRSDIVISSGGLGPTEDDVTMLALTRFLGKGSYCHRPTYRAILRRLKKRNLPMTRLISKQCFVPKGSTIFVNENGTAPGVLNHRRENGRQKWLLVLPGPPRELEPLFIKKALPSLIRAAKIKREHFVVRSVKISGLIEAQVAQKVTDLLKRKPPLTVGIYARPGEVELKIMAKDSSKHAAVAKADKIEKVIRRRLKEKIFGLDQESLASSVGTLLKKKRLSLSVAESCTGGFLSKCVTEIPGCSDYYRGGIIAYDNQIKVRELRIPRPLIRKYGAVSGTIAKKMAQNVKVLFQTDIGIGITGIAGPSGGSRRKPVGLVYIAISRRRATPCSKHLFLGSRPEIQERAAHEALDLLRLELLKPAHPT